jgi:hypothetical protein
MSLGLISYETFVHGALTSGNDATISLWNVNLASLPAPVKGNHINNCF